MSAAVRRARPRAADLDRAQREREAWMLWQQGTDAIYGADGGWAGNQAANRWLQRLATAPAWGRALKWHAASRHPHDKAVRGCALARLEDGAGRLVGVLRLFDPEICAARRLMPVMALGSIKGAALRLRPAGGASLYIADGVWAGLEIERELAPEWTVWAAPGAALGCPPAAVEAGGGWERVVRACGRSPPLVPPPVPSPVCAARSAAPGSNPGFGPGLDAQVTRQVMASQTTDKARQPR